MDALALLAGSDDDEEDVSDEGDDVEEAGASAGGADESVRVDFESLRKAGFSGSSLADTEMYQRLGSVSKPSASEADAPEAAREVEPPAPTPPQEDGLDNKTRQEILMRAAQRDRKRAGVSDQESVRKKNSRKMKMGQANFSLKDDRDCVNPFVDNSQAPHVAGYSGKRVDRHSSAKQISNLSFTS
mmetsp:Transcript_38747/g.91119  ORF Transcript_38747/g.91119 Transcript_38747/m.91119 type:complete len:186 (-) Transcript_38747:113-670(-)